MTDGNKIIIVDALKEALALIWDEYESILLNELRVKYDLVIQKSQNAIVRIEVP
jgi:hypothetical protein